MMLNFLIFLPVVTAMVILFLRKTAQVEGLTALSAILEFAAGLYVAFEAIPHVAPVSSYFGLDSLAGFFLLITITVSFLASLYSIGYLRAEFTKGIIGFRRIKQYFVLLQLFIATMIMAITTANPVVMWIAIEATTLATVFLISFYHKPASTEAAWKYLIINSIGLLLGFLGTLLYFTSFGGEFGEITTWQSLIAVAPHLNPFIAKLAFVFIFDISFDISSFVVSGVRQISPPRHKTLLSS
ncbi:MAG: hypothetical protein NTY66_04035 [Candidatus Vogelbacteria bacterium]|nr:hypothetical protein [Candidatus Vogelbacteria bacterium]